MPSSSALVRAAAIQLAAGLPGQVVALRRHRSCDVPVLTGSPDHVGRDSWWFGTGMGGGHLSERLCRRGLTPAGSGPVETPIVALGFGGTVAMPAPARRQLRP